jgi:hypothetical protein
MVNNNDCVFSNCEYTSMPDHMLSMFKWIINIHYEKYMNNYNIWQIVDDIIDDLNDDGLLNTAVILDPVKRNDLKNYFHNSLIAGNFDISEYDNLKV